MVFNLAIQMTTELLKFLIKYLKLSLVVFIGFSKAFDTVDHIILLKQFGLLNVRSNNHDWIKSYLSNRKKYIEINPTIKASLEQVKYEIPHGSMLSPCYIFYMSVISKMLQVSLIQ